MFENYTLKYVIMKYYALLYKEKNNGRSKYFHHKVSDANAKSQFNSRIVNEVNIKHNHKQQ